VEAGPPGASCPGVARLSPTDSGSTSTGCSCCCSVEAPCCCLVAAFVIGFGFKAANSSVATGVGHPSVATGVGRPSSDSKGSAASSKQLAVSP